MNIIKSFGLVIAAAVAFLVYSSIYVVDEREKALVLRFGEIQTLVEKPGLYLKLPIADTVVKIEDRIVIWESNDKDVQVSDSRQYRVDAITLARVSNSQKFRESVGADLEVAKLQIERRLDAALRQTYGKRAFDAALSKDRNVMMKEIRDQVRAEAENLGIDIVDVRIRRTDLQDQALAATYQRMASERLAEAKDLRGKGEASKLRIIAEADRKSVEIISAARRTAEIVRGEGDADRNRIFAAAFGQDPEFFSFYRTMQAYAKSLSTPGTTFLVKPDSQFFKYFGAEKVAPPAGQP
ncbi:protease modulator HflC [soil metagenome]